MDAVSIAPLRLDELVAVSAFSKVYRAWDPLLERSVAVKLFHLEPDKEARLPFPRAVWQRRFVDEAKLLAAIDHPHVVRVDFLGRLADGTPYVLMPYCVANLRREIGRDASDPDEIAALPPPQRPRRISPRRAAEILRQLCLGLAALHARGVVHRDVKPTNLLLTSRENGAVKLCDLGLAKGPGEPKADGIWLGTPDYAAPEQMVEASAVDGRADVYSAGVLGYRLLTGALPGPEARRGGALPELPGNLAPIIAAALAPDPAKRPPALVMAHRLSVLTFERAEAACAET